MKEALKIIQECSTQSLSFHPPTAVEKKEADTPKIIIESVREIASIHLQHYLSSRCIPPAIAKQFCKEVDFSVNGRLHTALGFQNNSGGFELRNKNFNGSSSPKGLTRIGGLDKRLCFFEGFFNFFPSRQSIKHRNPMQLASLICEEPVCCHSPPRRTP